MLSVTFTPSDKTDFTTVKASVPLTVNPSPLSLTWATPKAITYGAKLTSTQLNAAATFNGKRVAGAYAYTAVNNSGGPAITVDNKGYTTILPAGSYTLTATLHPDGPCRLQQSHQRPNQHHCATDRQSSYAENYLGDPEGDYLRNCAQQYATGPDGFDLDAGDDDRGSPARSHLRPPPKPVSQRR